jgi:hypothetical protein
MRSFARRDAAGAGRSTRRQKTRTPRLILEDGRGALSSKQKENLHVYKFVFPKVNVATH